MWPWVRTRYINVFRLDKHQTKKQVRLCKKKMCITNRELLQTYDWVLDASMKGGTRAHLSMRPSGKWKTGGLTSGMFAIFSNRYTLQILTLIWRISAPLVKKDHYQRTCQGNQESESTTEKLDWRNYNRMHQFKTGIETATFEKHAHTWTWDFKWEKNIKFCLEKNVVSLKKKML